MNYALPDLARVNEVLKKEKALLILKLHESVSYNTFESDLENVVYMNPNMDLYPVLPFTDVLITDYSSIYYDYLLMEKKGVIIYDFDYESYIEKEFPFYVDFKNIHRDYMSALLMN